MAIKLPISNVDIKPKSMYKKNRTKVSRVPRFAILALGLIGALILILALAGVFNFNRENKSEPGVVEQQVEVVEQQSEPKITKTLQTLNGECEFELSEVAPSGIKYQNVTDASAEYWWVNTECASEDIKGIRVVRYAVESQNNFTNAVENKVFSSATTSWAVALYQGSDNPGLNIDRYKSVLLNPVLNGADFYNVDKSEGSISNGKYTYYLSNGCLNEQLSCAVWRLDLSSNDQEQIFSLDGSVALTPNQPNKDAITLYKKINDNNNQILVINEDTLETDFDFEVLVGSELYDEYF